METHFLSHYCLTTCSLPSSIYLDMFTCTLRFVEGIGFGPVFVLWFTLGLLAAANLSMCAKTWPVLALVTQLSRASGRQNTPRTPLRHPQALNPWRSYGWWVVVSRMSCFLSGKGWWGLSSPSEASFSFPGLTFSLLRSGSCLAKAKGESAHWCASLMQKEVPSWNHFTRKEPNTPLREKTTGASRCLPMNKAGMKSGRNPTFC